MVREVRLPRLEIFLNTSGGQSFQPTARNDRAVIVLGSWGTASRRSVSQWTALWTDCWVTVEERIRTHPVGPRSGRLVADTALWTDGHTGALGPEMATITPGRTRLNGRV